MRPSRPSTMQEVCSSPCHGGESAPRRLLARSLLGLVAGALLLLPPAAARASCAAPGNAIEAENCWPGTPPETWDVSGAGDTTIQGFATNISVNQGDTVFFKIRTPAAAYRLDIYRMGYYQGNGARLVATVLPSAALPQAQPACLTDSSTGLIDCGNWAVSASWHVPAEATSGIYFAVATRLDTGGASHIVFIVRNDSGRSAILFQTSDTTWQAYNDYGGNNLYTGTSVGRAYKVSYNRPFNTRAFQAASWVFNAEYPMVRWLEANGYDVSYFTGVDSDRYGALIQNHTLWMSNGHDEYWSGSQRSNVEAARAAGVHLAFFSGNKIFWKTRWESSIDGSGTPYRTLVCYKETHANAVIDPADPPVWTGTWRDPRFSPPADGGRPENALAGSLFRVNGSYTDAIQVRQIDGRMRFWRNTSIASLGPGQTATLAPGTLGEEVDVDEDNGFRPPGLIGLSTTPVSTPSLYLLDYGSSYGAGTTTHAVTLYRHSSGALVFSTGSYQWAWGLDSNHDNDYLGSSTDARMQQATVNLLADMGVQPATLQAGLAPATASGDVVAPTSTITSPAAGSEILAGVALTITGTAVDGGGGVVAATEVSTDGGATWYRATGRENWSFTWAPAHNGTATLHSRAVDDNGNLETPSAGVSVTVALCPSGSCATIWPATAVPALVDQGADGPVELGVKFRSDLNGSITGIRFYKASTNTGTHVGHLWTSTGTLLASATFAGESPSGWQQVTFQTPVAISANTVYVASYHTDVGHYAHDADYFATAGVDNAPLHAPSTVTAGGNGVYAYGSTGVFPNGTYHSANYWVDVVLNMPPLSSIVVTPANSSIGTGATQQLTATAIYSDGTSRHVTSSVTWASSAPAVATIGSAGLATGIAAGSTTVSATLGSVSGSTSLTVVFMPLTIATGSLPTGTQNVAYAATLAAVGGSPPYSWSLSAGALPTGLGLSSTGVISGMPTATGTFTFTVSVADAASRTAAQSFGITILSQAGVTIWPGTAPGRVDAGADSPVELGVKFRTDAGGFITGLRFYKASTNTGTHVGNLWTSTGTLLASATFSGETASGWQQVSFSSPVAVAANTVYVASYHTNVGHYSQDLNYFATAGVDNAPLHALANGVSGGNGVYAYGPASVFPSGTYVSANYWVDVVFSAGPPPTLSSIAVTPASPTITTGATQQFTATGTYSDGSTKTITSQVTWSSSVASVATIGASGVAWGAGAGTTTIGAAQGGVSASTALTVQLAPLAISTTSVPAGTQGQPYSATLTAIGGSPPYAWSLSAGTLPAGLGLSAAGVISGTPTATGTSTFTVTVTDVAGLSASTSLGFVVVSSVAITIWPSATPGIVDHGADGSVELGVKFRSDVSGFISGIRFYKASTNTGTHVGNLWTSTGTLLASATFTGETASGWQQATFATPVAIAANTVYVASYHTDVGHYSQDMNYFAGAGYDNAPMHALADGVSGGNGVYAYGSTSSFPSGTYFATNYWVDVVFNPGP